MKRYIQLKPALPYFNILDKHFGLPYQELAIRLSVIERNEDDDDIILLTEYVSMRALKDVFDACHLVPEGEDLDYISLMWLVCNCFYGDNYNRVIERQENTPEANEWKAYDNVRKIALNLYLMLKDYTANRNQIIVEQIKFREKWEESTRERWRGRRAEIRIMKEREWGDDLNGPNWKYVQETIAKEANEEIENEMEWALHEETEWKRLALEREQLERATIKFGKYSVTLNWASDWFEALFTNHLFPHFIRDIESKDQVKALLKHKAGKKPEDKRITAIVHGLAGFFFEQGAVQSRTQRNLIQFIQKILELMTLKNNAGKTPSQQQIEKMIENLPHAKTDPKFYSATLKPVSKEELKIDQVEPGNELGWLLSPSRRR